MNTEGRRDKKCRQRRLFSRLIILFAIAWMTGCATISEQAIGYKMPGQSGVALSSGARIKMVVSGHHALGEAIGQALTQSFAKIAEENKQADSVSEQVIISDVNPTYWMFITVNENYRVDAKEAFEFNESFSKKKQENDAGGRELIVGTGPRQGKSATAAINVSLYSVHGLVPIYSFEITAYESTFKDATVDEASYYKRFADETASSICNSLLTSKKTVNTLLPNNTDSILVKTLASQDKDKMAAALKKAGLDKSLDAFLDEIVDLEKKGDAKVFADEKMIRRMCNYYAAAVDFEREHLDTRSLRLVRRLYLAMLRNTSDKGLIQACANSLGRVEYKLGMLGSLKD